MMAFFSLYEIQEFAVLDRNTLDLIGLILLVVLIGGGWILAYFVLKLIRRAEEKYQATLKMKNASLAGRLEFITGQVMNIHRRSNYLRDDEQRLMNGVYQQPSREIEVIKDEGWHCFLSSFGSCYVFDLKHFSPQIMIRKQNLSATLLRFYVQLIRDEGFVACEGVVDAEYDILCMKDDIGDVLAILSPDALEPIHGAPYSATIMVKKDKIFYVLFGRKKFEDTAEKIFIHASRVIPALNDNLGRWARSTANSEKLKVIESNPIGMTDEEYFLQPKGKFFTEF